MRVKRLRELLDGLPDDTLLATSDGDNMLTETRCYLSSVLISAAGIITRDYGEEVTPSSAHGKRCLAIIIE